MPRRFRNRGFLYIDALVTIALLAMIAALVLPSLRDDSHIRLVAAAEILTSDIELAQIMTIANPDDPVVVKVGSFGVRYWLAHESASDTPILRPDDGYAAAGLPYLVQFGQDRAKHAEGVRATINTMSNYIGFNGLGALDESTPTIITLTLGTRTIDLEVSPTTGSITQTSG